jgi:iron complex transport system substrate-binding protein
LQAEIAAQLIKQGIDVHAFNQRSIADILHMIRTLGALVDADDRARKLVDALAAGLADARDRAARLRQKPRVYFEEWDNPMISGIRWVSELIDLAGGQDIFSELSTRKCAKDRIITASEVIRREPDVIIGSWCGKKFRPKKVASRPGFDCVPAVVRGAIHEIKSSLILQPGPAALTDGLASLQGIIAHSVR